MTKTMAKVCWFAKATFSPSLFLSLLYAPVVSFFFVRSPQSFYSLVCVFSPLSPSLLFVYALPLLKSDGCCCYG
jgi:hypothetical protein